MYDHSNTPIAFQICIGRKYDIIGRLHYKQEMSSTVFEFMLQVGGTYVQKEFVDSSLIRANISLPVYSS
jgi:hypothetical protein